MANRYSDNNHGNRSRGSRDGRSSSNGGRYGSSSRDYRDSYRSSRDSYRDSRNSYGSGSGYDSDYDERRASRASSRNRSSRGNRDRYGDSSRSSRSRVSSRNGYSESRSSRGSSSRGSSYRGSDNSRGAGRGDNRDRTSRSYGSTSRYDGGSSKGRIESAIFNDEKAIKNSNRAPWILVFFLVFAAILFGRLFFLQVIVAGDYSSQAHARMTDDSVVYAKRGTIYDRNGNVLATSVQATSIYCNPKEVTDAQQASQILAEILGGDQQEYLDDLTKDSTFVYILRKGDSEKAEQLKNKYTELQQQIDAEPVAEGQEARSNPLTGIHYLDDMKRVYPYGRVAGQVIGYVGTDGDGLSGLELEYNDILKGTNGHRVVEYGKGGIAIPGGTKVDEEAVDGQDIMISIDIDLQQHAEEQLAAYAAEGGTNNASIIIEEGSTGEIYAAASLPFYDLNDVSNAEEGASSLKAISTIYEPGSVFKSVTAAALLEEGKATPSEGLYVPPSLKYGDRTITDAHAHGGEYLTFQQVLEQSSNIGISLLEERLGDATFYSYLTKFGFGSATGVDYPGESAGILQEYSNWSDVHEANISFGQGISVTSMQMVSFYSMVAAGGTYVKPHFLIGYPSSNQTVEYDKTQVLSQSSCDQLTQMLIGVVENGTGKAAAIQGYDVAGKTGTSQKVLDDGSYSDNQYWIDFDGFIANTDSTLACVVMMDNPSTSAAMPTFRGVMGYVATKYGLVAK